MAKKTFKKTKKISYEEKILRVVLLSALIILILVFVIAYIINLPRSFEYRGVKFKVVNFCDQGPCLKTYNTQLPVTYRENGQLKKANYNFYLRNDPRTLEKKVVFEGNLSLKKNLFMDITFDKSCKGYESVAVANFATLYRIMDVNINATSDFGCDLLGNSMYISLQESNSTNIKQIGPACYEINIKDCEILEGMERFMVETFVKLNEKS
ncbi:MAG: hypothetical protein KatS3mg001_426 [Candidatus Pacearchaeota archaeon]|nr:MAG: hypothetical protein KatS3mg001_426 [Candidatus Pacearchaeota archaeon]